MEERKLPRDKEAWHFLSEGLRHVSAADVSNALEGQVDEDGIAAGEVILDGLNHQLHEVIAGTHKHRDEQIALQRTPDGCTITSS